MTTNQKRTEAVALAILIAGGVAYAAAQQQPAQPKAPDTSTDACPAECQHECNMMQGNKGGMMGGMHGQNGMMNGMHDGQNGMHDGASCPMDGMRAMADVKIENTKNGAVIRMNAKKADQVAQIQQMAQRMTQCMGNAEPAAAPKTPR
jgi:hypothetical protein